jgi:hypothetical protein
MMRRPWVALFVTILTAVGVGWFLGWQAGLVVAAFISWILGYETGYEAANLAQERAFAKRERD